MWATNQDVATTSWHMEGPYIVDHIYIKLVGEINKVIRFEFLHKNIPMLSSTNFMG
jgi:hypothetical protein